MSKKLHPAVKLTNAVIRWFNKPKTYVRDSTRFYEFKDGASVTTLAEGLDINDVNKQVCRTCLIGAMYLQGERLKIDSTYQGLLMDELDNLVDPIDGYAQNRNHKQAQNIFIKVKKNLEAKIKRGELV